jgi:hypothetical protein
MYIVHWAACAFYFIARQENLTSNSWLGSFPDLLATWPSRFDSYVFSLYWAVATFATVGYGAISLTSYRSSFNVLLHVKVYEMGLNPIV